MANRSAAERVGKENRREPTKHAKLTSDCMLHSKHGGQNYTNAEMNSA